MANNLPDVFLLAVFKKLSTNERINACLVCINWFHRVRELHKSVRNLTIIAGESTAEGTTDFNLNLIDEYNFGYVPSMKQQLMKFAETEEPEEENHEKLECTNELNTLHFHTTRVNSRQHFYAWTAKLIMAAFPFVTELNFVNLSSIESANKNLSELLDVNRGWSKRLTAVRLKDNCVCQVSPRDSLKLLFEAINSLPSLKRLSIDVRSVQIANSLRNLPILSRLKEIRLSLYREDFLKYFLSSVEKYAADNGALRIDLIRAEKAVHGLLDPYPKNSEAPTLESSIRERIIRVTGISPFFFLSLIKLFADSFPLLSSISLSFDGKPRNCAPTFAALSERLSHLRHLHIFLNFSKDASLGSGSWDTYPREDDQVVEVLEDGHQIIRPVSPTAALPSVVALELEVIVESHFDVQWLNIPVTMPNLQAIHFGRYNCVRCNVSSFVGNVTENCFGAELTNLSRSTGVSLEQISVTRSNRNIFSAKQLFDE